MPFSGFAPPQGFAATSVLSTAFPLLAPDGSASAPSYSWSTAASSNSGFYLAGGDTIGVSGNGVLRWAFDATGATYNLWLLDSSGIAWGASLGAGSDLFLYREAAATLQMGADVNGAAVAQTLKAHDGITGTDIAGANLTLAGGRGTGSGAPGDLILSVATELATGTTAQTLAAILTMSGGNNASVRNHLLYTAPTADLAMTASTEAIGAVFGGTATYTREWATGALALQRENLFQGPTYAFVGASTLTAAVNVEILQPLAGANATLTKSDALRVQAGTGTGRAAVGGMLHVNTADTTTTGTSEETLASYTLPGGTLSHDAKGVRIRAWGVCANNTNSKTLKITFGATAVSNTTRTTPANAHWVIVAEVFRTGAATQNAWGDESFSSAVAGPLSTTPAETLSGDITVAFKATTPTSAGDVTIHGFTVEYLS